MYKRRFFDRKAYLSGLLDKFGWRRGVVVSGVGCFTKLSDTGPGYYLDG